MNARRLAPHSLALRQELQLIGGPVNPSLYRKLSHHIISVTGIPTASQLATVFEHCGGNALANEHRLLLAGSTDAFARFTQRIGSSANLELTSCLQSLTAEEPLERVWECRGRSWVWGQQTCVMGVVNVTPDSFSDGGKFLDQPRALDHALQLVEDGADILDIGGESSRPSATPVPPDEELRRVIPLVQAIAEQTPVLVSVDTYKAQVAAEALSAGAHIVNDITSLSDPDMASFVAEAQAGLILMHMQGTPQTMQNEPHYQDVVTEVHHYLHTRMEVAVGQGVARRRIAIDPGIGFGKLLEHNLEILRRIEEFRSFTVPVLIGTSRKSFIGHILDRPVDDRLLGTAATVACAILRGADIVRVHDVVEMKQIATMTDALR